MRALGAAAVAVAAVVLGSGAAAQAPSPEASPAGGPSQELLGVTFPDVMGRDRLVLLRTTLEPGQRLDDVGWGGASVSWVQSGELTLTVDAGTVLIAPAGGEGGMVADGDTAQLGALDTIRGGPETRMSWANEDRSQAIVLTSAIIPEGGGDGTSLPGDSPAPTETPGPKEAPPVVRTVVVRRTGPVGQPATYTIRDQSGWVVGARVPDEEELRSWPRELFGATPVRATGRDTFDLLVTWSGTGCGPTVTLTVGPRLRSMRLVDRSPGCDASAMGHWLVLELRTTVGIPMREIPFESIRRRPS
jgi:hypothetical protein